MVYTTGVSYSWISCFNFLLLIHKVSVHNVRVESVIGQTVMLPCSMTEKPVEVYWRYKGERMCDIIGGKADCDKQDPAYRGRVNIFSSEIEKGNFSIMLSNVMKSDEGTYFCKSPGVHTVEVALTVTVLVQNVRVESVIGQTVMLPCSVTQKPVEVYWRYKGRSVCDIIGTKADCDKQNPAYRGRVNIFSSEIEKGNFSIMLSNVMKSDEGTYTCKSHDVHTVEVALTVTERRQTTGSSGKRRADGLLTVLLACALLYSLVF